MIEDIRPPSFEQFALDIEKLSEQKVRELYAPSITRFISIAFVLQLVIQRLNLWKQASNTLTSLRSQNSRESSTYLSMSTYEKVS